MCRVNFVEIKSHLGTSAAEYRAMLGVTLAAWSEEWENWAWLLGRPSRSPQVISPSGHNI